MEPYHQMKFSVISRIHVVGGVSSSPLKRISWHIPPATPTGLTKIKKVFFRCSEFCDQCLEISVNFIPSCHYHLC